MDRPRIVIVDDDEELLQELSETLNMNGYEVEIVGDPGLATRVIEETLPEVVLLDLRMKGKNGFEIAEDLSRNPNTSEVPVIAMTGFFSDEEAERLERLGTVKGFLTKPFGVSEVIAKISEVRRLL